MNIPAELVVCLIGGLGAIGSFIVHLLIRISSDVSTIKTDHKVAETEFRAELEAARRHNKRNSEEIAWMKQHHAGDPA